MTADTMDPHLRATAEWAHELLTEHRLRHEADPDAIIIPDERWHPHFDRGNWTLWGLPIYRASRVVGL